MYAHKEKDRQGKEWQYARRRWVFAVGEVSGQAIVARDHSRSLK